MGQNSNDRSKLIQSYTLNATLAPFVIQQYAENIIKPILTSIKGINNINVFGATPMEWVMEYDADLLKTYSITVKDIQQAVNTYLSSSYAGLGHEYIPGGVQSMIHLVIRNHSQVNIDFNNIPVKKCNNRIVYLRDIVTIKHLEQEPTSYFRINGNNAINIVVYADNQENQVKLGKAIKEKIAAIEKNLPQGYFIFNSYDATNYITAELNKNIFRTIATLIILLLFVFFVSRQPRFLFLVVISLIANLSIAIIFYYFLKIEMHLYSMAGITISLGLIIDNCIMMIFHYRQQHNLKVFLASLAANLCAIGSLTTIFFLNESIGNYLVDMGIVVIINLFVSLGVVLFLVPSLMEVLPLRGKKQVSKRAFLFFKRKPSSQFRLKIKIIYIYFGILRFIGRFKWAFIILAILCFGLPVFMLPSKIENPQGWFGKTYNNTIGSEWYKLNARPIAETVLGGTLRLFVQKTFEYSSYGEKEKTTLYANPKLPPGSIIGQINDIVVPIEKYLKQFKEIKQFQATINQQSAQIVVYFTDAGENSGFPSQLKELLINEANNLAGADWEVYGTGEGFSNSLMETVGSNRITLHGYNYDDLYLIAEKIKTSLMKNPRVQEVNILSSNTWYKNLSYEYVMDFDRRQLATLNITPNAVYSSLSNYAMNENRITTTIINGVPENVRIESKQSKKMDMWQVKNAPAPIEETMVKLNPISSVKKEAVSLDVCKDNKQYRLILAYEYIGTTEMSRKHQQMVLDEIAPNLPLGYSVIGDSDKHYWGKKDNKQFLLLFLIIGTIFFIASVLFESLLLPLAVILMIPISYIGIFLTFFIFNLNFDQGGFAAFILLSGITVNAALYIINDFNNLQRKYKNSGRSIKMLYFKAFNYKIIPILLIIFSTALGLVPFLWDSQKEVFWPGMAAGTIGGLIFSLVGIVFYLPLFLGIKIKQVNRYIK
jgi:multidrug efflux pump subunit AcrB